MSIFEYVAVAYSLIIALAVSRLITGMPDIWRRGSAYWPARIWWTLLLLMTFSGYWSFWGYNEVEVWSAASFLFALLSPSMYLLAAVVLIPNASADVGDWRKHFLGVRQLFFGALLLNAILFGLTANLLLNLPLFFPERIGLLAVCILFVAGMVFGNERAQYVIAALGLVLIGFASTVLVFDQGAVATFGDS